MQLQQRLAKLVELNRVPHALLFAGLEGEKIGHQFAIDLLAQDGAHHRKKALAHCHPDLYIFQTEGKGGTHPIKNMRELTQAVALAPLEATRKVFLIHDADRMAPVSSNALLKTFEEPPADTVIILLTTTLNKILPTIRSRCFIVELHAEMTHSALPDMIELLAHRLSSEAFSAKYQDTVVSDPLFQKVFLQTWMHWYRDGALLRIDPNPSGLHFPEQIDSLKKTKEVSLEKVERLLRQVELALERSVKLSVCLDVLRNQCP